MSDGISLNSPCCNSLAIHKEYEQLKVKFYHKKEGFYDSHIHVYTCRLCGLKWAIERVVKGDDVAVI